MADRQIINIGSTIDDGTGDLLRDAFVKVNDNFESLWEVTAVNSNIDITGDTIESSNQLVLSPADELLITSSVIVNSNNTDSNFAINGESHDNVLFVDAGNSRVGIKTDTPTAELDVVGSAKISGMTTTGNLTVTGSTTIGNDVSDIVNFNARSGTNLEPYGTRTIGTLINRWDNGYFNNIDVTGTISGTFSGTIDPSTTLTNDIDNANVTCDTLEVSTSAEIETLLVQGNLSVQGSSVSFTNTSAPLTSVGQVGDTSGLVAFDDSYVYYCTGSYDGSTDIWKRVAWSVDTW